MPSLNVHPASCVHRPRSQHAGITTVAAHTSISSASRASGSRLVQPSCTACQRHQLSVLVHLRGALGRPQSHDAHRRSHVLHVDVAKEHQAWDNPLEEEAVCSVAAVQRPWPVDADPLEPQPLERILDPPLGLQVRERGRGRRPRARHDVAEAAAALLCCLGHRERVVVLKLLLALQPHLALLRAHVDEEAVESRQLRRAARRELLHRRLAWLEQSRIGAVIVGLPTVSIRHDLCTPPLRPEKLPDHRTARLPCRPDD
mmetsp:Transcript_39170/g.76588  ORF Transcript_39170/g.76588 Transcript_39170/m.76588 type:complete len:258 (+) Transcript_39170:1-774(+)